jgi:inner membrane protein
VASAFPPAVAALSMGACFYQPQIPKRVWLAGVAWSVLPDLDVIGFRFGIRYSDFWGASRIHAFVGFRRSSGGCGRDCDVPAWSIWDWEIFPVRLLPSCNRQPRVLDAMTNGGLGVAFFSPFDNRRYFLPWRPIRVFTNRGYTVLQPAGICHSAK